MKFTPTLGSDYSGSIGGVTASHNKGGPYFRLKSVPTNPNSPAQAAARADFAAATSLFHTLSSVQKGNWNQYAADYYTPRGGRIPGVLYTGQQAFAGHRMNLLNMNRWNDADDVNIILPAGSTVAPVPADTSLIDVPANAFSALVQTGAGTPVTITPLSATIDISSTTVTLTMQYGGHGSPVAFSPVDFVDPVSGLNVGYIILASRGSVQEGTSPIARKATLLASTGIVGAYSGTGTSSTSVQFEMANVDMSSDRMLPSDGEIVTLDIYAMSSQGHTQPLGSVQTTVSA